MKALWIAISIALFLNVLAGAGFVGWLYGTERLNEDRMERLVGLFSMTLQEEAAAKEREHQATLAQARIEAQAAHLRRVAAGPQSMTDRLAIAQQVSDIAAEQNNRSADDVMSVERRLEQAWEDLRQQKARLDAERQAYETQTREQRDQREDEAFQQTVALYESLPPKQAREQFMTLIASGNMDQVVDYLAQMNKRKAVGVLGEFKQPGDAAVATELLERLRVRGSIDVNENVAADPQGEGGAQANSAIPANTGGLGAQ